MKEWKRVLALCTGATLSISLLAACSSSSGSTASGNSSGTNTSDGGWQPERSITMLVPWSAGGGSDLAVRTLVPYLEDDLGVSITVVNSTGANGWIAWNELLNSDQMDIPLLR